MAGYKIGYEQLNPQEKRIYELFEKAFSSFASSVDINSIGKNVNIMKVLQVALGDNPQVFYFNKTQIKVYGSLFGGKQLHFCGIYSLNQIKKMQKEVTKVLKVVLEDIALLNPISDYDKLICIYEYLQDNVTYNSKELESCCKGKSVNTASHNAYGALIEKTAVCDGIAAAFSLLAQHMGFDCTIVSGSAAFRTTEFSSHAWNVIRVGDRYYHVDATWDINHKEQTGEYSYEYFCVDDDLINLDHNWEINTTPACNSNALSFYVRNKCYANNLSQLEEIFRQYARSKTKVVRVRISDKIALPEPDDRYIAQCLLNTGVTVGRYNAIDFMWNKDTRCFYAKYK